MNPTQIKGLFEERNRLVAEARAVYDTAETEKRSLTAEETAADEKRGEAIADLDRRIQAGLDQVERDRLADEHRSRYADLVGTADLPVAEAARAEAEALRQIARGERRSYDFHPHADEVRDLVKGTASAGGNLVPTTLYGSLFETFREVSSVVENGATVLRTASGETISLPKVTAYSAASIVAEAAAIPESDPAVSLVSLGAYKYAFLVQVSSELVQDSQFDLTGFLSRQGGVSLGHAVNVHFLTGTGSGQPEGVVTAAPVGVTGATAGGTAISPDELMALYHSIPSAFRANASWIMDDTTALHVRQKKDSTGQYLWQPGLTLGQPDTLLGRPVITDPNIVDLGGVNRKVAVFSDLRGYYARFAGPVRIERSDDFAFANDLVTFRFIVRADGKLVDSTATRALQTAAA